MPKKKLKVKKATSGKAAKVVKSPKKKAPVKEKSKKISKKESLSPKWYDQLKLSESYVSLVLGAIVVAGIAVIFFAYVKESKDAVATEKVLHASVSPVPTKAGEKVYTIQDNESLWDVAVKFYGDGFAWTRIVDANKDRITNPDYVPPGTKIIIPNAQQ